MSHHIVFFSSNGVTIEIQTIDDQPSKKLNDLADLIFERWPSRVTTWDETEGTLKQFWIENNPDFELIEFLEDGPLVKSAFKI